MWFFKKKEVKEEPVDPDLLFIRDLIKDLNINLEEFWKKVVIHKNEKAAKEYKESLEIFKKSYNFIKPSLEKMLEAGQQHFQSEDFPYLEYKDYYFPYNLNEKFQKETGIALTFSNNKVTYLYLPNGGSEDKTLPDEEAKVYFHISITKKGKY